MGSDRMGHGIGGMRTGRRRALVSGMALVAVGWAAGPALAHVEVSADGARALAKDVTLAFTAESESADSGIASLRVVAPEGIAPADVRWGAGPKGWVLAPAADGWTASGPALPAGEDVRFTVVVRQLPDARELAFKTLQTYADGRVDRWIEVPSQEGEEAGGGHGHGNQAPVLKLEPAARGAVAEPAPSPSSSAPAPASASPSRTTGPGTAGDGGVRVTASARPAEAPAGGPGPAVWVLGGVAVLAAAGAAGWAWLRRRGAGGG
ncbi:DUF1775 domain-containing protein (plasmid) [Streptomyces sp. BI20]|uniref:DUF1775 domain-containing protein n=1 Tax=Streptomyces sp. BI20 TaxID=3403460 RepID=UPI003C77F291